MRIHRSLVVGGIVVFAALVGASPAYAANVHLKGGANAEPAFTDNVLTLEAAGALAGLGNGDVLVSLTATGLPTADCVNPGSGEHRPPGQNPAEVTLTGVQRIPESELKNGTTPFDVELTAAQATRNQTGDMIGITPMSKPRLRCPRFPARPSARTPTGSRTSPTLRSPAQRSRWSSRRAPSC